MNKLLIIFGAAFLALSRASLLQPRSLVDEAKEQLNELRSIVRGDIMVAHDDLDNLIYDFGTNSLNIRNEAALAINQQQQVITADADAAINLAESGGYNVTDCYYIRHTILNQLPDRFLKELDVCLEDSSQRTTRAARDAKYIIDINMNKIHDLENQLNRCREDFLCISPLITEIELNKIRLPQNIRTEILAIESLFYTIELSVQSCINANIAGYTSGTYTVFKDLERCITIVMNRPTPPPFA